jgi:hypothetical protein
METVYISEALLYTYKSTRLYKPEYPYNIFSFMRKSNLIISTYMF